MVRKKANDHKKQNPSQETTDHSKDSTFKKPPNPLSRQSSIEDPKEKLQNLKSLNSLLLKEAFESRQQIESLVQAKVALEDELSQKKKLEVEENEKKLSFELQNESVYVYVETQMKELGDEKEKMIGALEKKVNELTGSLENERELLSLVYKENDLARKDFDLQVNEVRLMKEKLMEMEGNERKFVEKIGKMKVEYNRLNLEKDELEKVKISMVKDKDLFEKNMKSKAEEVEHLRKENEEIVREKKGIEIEKNEQSLKICEMENELRGMNELIVSLREQDVTLRSKILELEKNCDEAMNREAEKAIEIGSLVEEKRAKERSIERLMEEKDFVSRSLESIMAESDDRQRRIEELSKENDEARTVLETNEKEFKDMHKKIDELSSDKIEIEKAKIHKENENVELRNEVIELRNVVHRLQEECFDHQKKNNELVSEVNHVKDLVDRTILERDNALKRFDEEKRNGVNLTSKVSEMQNVFEKTKKELARKKNECENLINEKEEIASRIGSMVEDKERLHKELSETKRSLNDSRAKMESTNVSYNRALTLLKNTASLVCQSSEEENNLDDEPYVTELEAIKNAFKNKETVAKDMMQKVKLMEKSMVETEKKKSFWTMVSSATMLFAAVAMAYAAKGR